MNLIAAAGAACHPPNLLENAAGVEDRSAGGIVKTTHDAGGETHKIHPAAAAAAF
jgi:hypothetical protein